MRMLIMMLVLGWATAASAQAELDLGAEDEALALALAQVCANESSLGRARPADCALIWQTTRRRGGETAAGRLAWLTRHSQCVLDLSYVPTERELLGNCRWSRYLTASDAEPEGWNEGVWDRYIERWASMRSYCRHLVAGHRPRGGWPCPRDPDTWGGEMDRARALRAGLVPLDCEGTSNEGYRFGPVAPRE